MEWVRRVLTRTRGRELVGNFNPLLIGELFWEQASSWHAMAEDHLEDVSRICNKFLESLLKDMCPKDVESRLWGSRMQDTLKNRRAAASQELSKIMEDLRSYPINYNHYYTDTIRKNKESRDKASLTKALADATEKTSIYDGNAEKYVTTSKLDVEKAWSTFNKSSSRLDMESFSCEEALDCLFAIYKVRFASLSCSTSPIAGIQDHSPERAVDEITALNHRV